MKQLLASAKKLFQNSGPVLRADCNIPIGQALRAVEGVARPRGTPMGVLETLTCPAKRSSHERLADNQNSTNP